MKIFAAGIATETNTFSLIPTGMEDFDIVRGRDVRAGLPHNKSQDLSDIWGKMAEARGHDFVFSLKAWAEPSGTTLRWVYESLRDEMLEDLKSAMPVDVVLLQLHGAMVAEGYDDCEEDMIRRTRTIVGPDAIIGVELDLHCHVRPSTIEQADVVITYKEYPHFDINDRAIELFDLCVAAKNGEIKPTMALFDCKMVGQYPTSRQPLRGFVDAMTEAEKREGVLSVSFGHGFRCADVPHVGAKMLVVTDNDLTLAEEMARDFGMRVHAMRSEICFSSFSLPIDEAMAKALANERGPVVIADQADNTGGGAPGDSTFALQWVIDHKTDSVAIAILYDPEVVKIAKKAGVGARISVRLGGKLGVTSGDPIDLDVTVIATADNYMLPFPQQTGDPPLYPLGDVAALRYEGIDIVVSSERCQCFSPVIFSDLGIDPLSRHILIVKSSQHFYGGFAPIASEVIYMTTQGATPADPRLANYRRFDTTGIYPWTESPFSS